MYWTDDFHDSVKLDQIVMAALLHEGYILFLLHYLYFNLVFSIFASLKYTAVNENKLVSFSYA